MLFVFFVICFLCMGTMDGRDYMSLSLFPSYTVFKKIKNNIFETCFEFFPIEIRAQWDTGGRRPLLGSNTGIRISYYGQTCASVDCVNVDSRPSFQNVTTA
jgi:hypothetical protein